VSPTGVATDVAVGVSITVCVEESPTGVGVGVAVGVSTGAAIVGNTAIGVSTGGVAVGVAPGGGVAVGVAGIAVAVGVAPGGGVAVGVAGIAVAVGVAGIAVAVGVAGIAVAVGVAGIAVAVGVAGIAVGVGVAGTAVGVGVAAGGSAHAETAMVSLSRVTAPLSATAPASNRPTTVALFPTVMVVCAITVPWRVELAPSVAELPICQKTLQAWAPPARTTELDAEVISVDPALKTQMSFALPLSVRGPAPAVIPKVPEA